MKKSMKAIIATIICFCMLFSSALPALAAAAEAAPEATTVNTEVLDNMKYYLARIGTAVSDVMGALASVTDYVKDENTIFGDIPTAEEIEDGSFLELFLAKVKKYFAKIINYISDFFINAVIAKTLADAISPNEDVLSYEDFNVDEYADFYAGMSDFKFTPGSGWKLGYSSKSIMPADFGEKEYAKGAYLPYVMGSEMYLDDDGVAEELRVRTIVLEDGSGRGKVAFCVIDAMGLCNSDVRLVREALSAFAAQNNIISINVSCTHIHTGIDSQGVWTDPVGVASFNGGLQGGVKHGVDQTFIDAIVKGCSEAVMEATNSMASGKLLYSEIDIAEYVRDRTAPVSIDTMLYKLEFVPDSVAVKPTIIATFGCHPESSSYDWKTTDANGKTVYDTKFSTDFIWYMEKVINAAGYNFIYIQGDVCTATSSRGLTSDGLDRNAHDSALRYGYELGYIVLGMGLTNEQRIALNAATGDRLGVAKFAGNEEYSVWYEGLETVTATEIEPILNIAHSQFTIEIENNAMAALGKMGISDNLVLQSENNHYYTVSEVGYMVLGNNFLQIYISPGETFGELLMGGNGIKDFPFASIRDTLGENTIIFDLTNDAAGYVANDANYVMVGLQYNENTGKLDSDTWCIISYGRHAASTFIGKLYDLAAKVK